MKNQLEKNESYLGFTDNKTVLQKAKIEKCLDKVFRYDDGIMARKDKVLNDLRSGRKPVIVEVTNSKGNTKKEYRMTWDNLFYEITKTEYDFCTYLVEHDLVSKNAVNAFIEAENLRKEKAIEEQKKAEETARIEEERIEAEKENFKIWVAENSKKYENTIKGNLVEQIYLSVLGEFYHPYKAFELLVCIDNIEKPLCRKELKARLHKDNKASRKVFQCVTGLKLPNTNKETMEFLDNVQKSDYQGMTEFKERKKSDKQPEKEQEQFYILMKNDKGEMEFKPKPGVKINHKGVDMFIHETPYDKIGISSVKCGLRIATGKNRTETIKIMKELFRKNGAENIQNKIDEVVNAYGVSPYCKHA